MQAVRSGKWKLVFPRKGRKDNERLLNRSVVFQGEIDEPVPELALYNLETDVGEALNVAAERPDVVARLDQLAEKRNELGDHDRIGSGVRFWEDGPKWPNRQQWLK